MSTSTTAPRNSVGGANSTRRTTWWSATSGDGTSGAARRSRRNRRVEPVDEHAQARPAVAVEAERDAREVDVVVVGDLVGRRVDDLHLAPHHDVGELAR